MEGELLTSSSSATKSLKTRTYTEIMEEHFPIYLEAGMTPADYWDGDMTLVIPYREALERRREWQNQMLWLQGLYIYNALTAVMPALSIKTKGVQIEPYLEKPIPITERSRREQEKRIEREKYEKNMAHMRTMAERINARFKRKAESADISDKHQ